MSMTATQSTFANKRIGSDIHPYEVLSASPKAMTVREMNAECAPNAPRAAFTPGGFLGHFDNDAYNANWVITPNPDGETVKIRLHKDGVWRDSHGGRYSIADAPRKFYDANF